MESTIDRDLLYKLGMIFFQEAEEKTAQSFGKLFSFY
jgi:hypothetical protein